MSKKARLVVIGIVVVFSVLIALLANFLISKSKIKEPPTKPEIEKVARKTFDSSVSFGEDISPLRDLNKGDIASRIQAFNETYDLGIEDASVTSLTWKSGGVVVTNSVDGYEFITDYYGSVLGFISRSTLSSSSLKKVSSSFSVISLGDGRALYLGSITNGLVGKGGKPIIKVNRLSGSEIPSSTKVDIEKLPDIWKGLDVSEDGLEFTRFIVSPSGVELAEYIDEDGNYLYYSLYSVAEDGKQVIRGKFSGIMTTKYNAKITDLFVKNVSQFGIFEVKDGGILWITY